MTEEWTIQTIKEHFDRILAEHAKSHEERHQASELAIRLKQEHVDTQIAALDRRVDDRFNAAEKAVRAALESQDKATNALFTSQEKAIQAALAAASTAVNKAEVANEKRFEGVNEFRAQLGDQQRNLMPRTEADAEFRALREKISSLTQRIDRSEGRGTGLQAGWVYLIGAVGLAGSVIGIILILTR